MLKNVLLTGAPGAGKTTLIKKAVRRLGDRAGGFFTEEVRQGNRRQGFRLVALDGGQGLLAERGAENAYRVGDYGVNLTVLEEIAAPALQRALEEKSVVVADEIGLMEIGSQPFVRVLQECLDSSKPVLGTLGRQEHPILDAVRGRSDTLVIEVTRANRDRLLDRIFGGLRLPTESFAETERNIAKKQLKAQRYAQENRLGIIFLAGRFTSDHHVYDISYDRGQWHCNCSFFLKYGTCSHTMASAKILESRLREGE
ncbi:MAG: NTPase [Firmicutes bacterium]|nr:NTPase [Bacillota bacterium]